MNIEEVIQPVINEYEAKQRYYSIFGILCDNYFVPDNTQFCASQDDISELQVKYYETITKFINDKVHRREACYELFRNRKK